MLSKKLRQLCDEIVNHPAVQCLVPLEASWSYPVPVFRGGRLYLRFFLYQRERDPVKTVISFYPPFAVLSVDTQTGGIVEFSETSFTKGETTEPLALGKSPHAAARGLDYEDLERLDEEFYGIIEETILFMAKDISSPQKQAKMARFRELFEILVEPELRPYYEELNPDYYQLVPR